jgi:N-acetylglucosamine repressor
MEHLSPFGNSTDKTGTNEHKKIALRKQVIELLYTRGHSTIAELCEPSRTSIPTMAYIVNELIEEQWVKRFGIGESKGGRKPALYGLHDTSKFIAGIDLSRQNTRIGIFNLNNQPVTDIVKISQGLDTSPHILKLIKKEMDQLLQKTRIKKNQILGYGITIPGLIDSRKGVSYSYPQFNNRRLSDIFGALFDGVAFIEHDTKAMAVGEAWFGQAKNKSNVLCLNIGSGIGLGMIINGMLYQGHSGFSGEFGHIQMDPGGDLCYCGKIGCLETIASGTAMVKKAKQKIAQGQSTSMQKIAGETHGEMNLATIIEAANQGDQFAIELIENAGEYLARGLATLIHLLNPEAIIIGGDIARAGNLISETIKQKLNKYAMAKIMQDASITLSELKENARLLGALPVVMMNTFSQSFGQRPFFSKNN